MTIQHELKISHRHVSPKENVCQVEGIPTVNKHTLSDYQEASQMWSVVEPGARLSEALRNIVRTSAFGLREIRSHLSFLKHHE